MKKYIIFVISFIVLFLLFQVLSGILLTSMYTPDVGDAWNASANLPQETTIVSGQNSFLLTLLMAVLSASIAYFIPKEFMNHK